MSRTVLTGIAVLMILLGIVLFIITAFGSDAGPHNACPNVEPGVTPNPVLATACPDLYHQADQGVPNAYLRPAPAGNDAPDWLEMALPSGRWLIHSGDCALNPWTEVWYHSSAPNLAGVNDCALDAWIYQSPTPCDMNDQGVCDLTQDQSYQDWLGHQRAP